MDAFLTVAPDICRLFEEWPVSNERSAEIESAPEPGSYRSAAQESIGSHRFDAVVTGCNGYRHGIVRGIVKEKAPCYRPADHERLKARPAERWQSG